MEMKGRRRLEMGEDNKGEAETKKSNFNYFLSNARQIASSTALFKKTLYEANLSLHVN